VHKQIQTNRHSAAQQKQQGAKQKKAEQNKTKQSTTQHDKDTYTMRPRDKCSGGGGMGVDRGE